jgi:arabinofuranosyltransferase
MSERVISRARNIRSRLLRSAPFAGTARAALHTAWHLRFYYVGLVFFLTALMVEAGVLQWVCDDAFISFRYARNFVNGNGLVYNVGERVEGYTNFLWIVELSVLQLLTQISFSALSQILSVLMTVGVFYLIVRLARQYPIAHRRHWVALLAVGFWALNRNTALWTTSGLETRQFTFFILLAIVFVTEGESRKTFTRASWALAASALTRPEGLMIGVSFLFWAALRHRPASAPQRLQQLVALAVPLFLVVGTHYLFRYSYYGLWLPNTYYAKVVRPWPDAGFLYMGAAFLESGLYFTLPFIALGVFVRRLHRCASQLFLFACLLFPHMAYLVKVGGDHFEYRPLDFYFPLLAIMTAEGVVFFGVLLRILSRRVSSYAAKTVEGLTTFGAAVGVVAYGAVIQVAEYSLTYDADFAGSHVKPEITESRFPAAFILPFMRDLVPLYDHSTEILLKHAIGVKWREHERFSDRQQKSFAAYDRRDRRRLPPDAVMAYPYAGILPFSLDELTVIDTHGLTDATIARNGSRPNSRRVMAHDRWAPPDYLESRGVNIEVLPATSSASEALRRGSYAAKLADDLWMPFKTSRPKWAEQVFSEYSLTTRPRWSKGENGGTAFVDGQRLKVKQVLATFEDNGFKGWSLEGAMARREGAVSGQQRVTGFCGRWFLGSFEPESSTQAGDKAVGQARSAEFYPEGGDYLYLLLAGGADAGVGVELLSGSESVQAVRATGNESLQHVWIDLAEYEGAAIKVRVFDESRGHYGHILLDQVVVFGRSS